MQYSNKIFPPGCWKIYKIHELKSNVIISSLDFSWPPQDGPPSQHMLIFSVVLSCFSPENAAAVRSIGVRRREASFISV